MVQEESSMTFRVPKINLESIVACCLALASIIVRDVIENVVAAGVVGARSGLLSFGERARSAKIVTHEQPKYLCSM